MVNDIEAKVSEGSFQDLLRQQKYTLLFSNFFYSAVWHVKATILVYEKESLFFRLTEDMLEGT